jgi:hypothetical protein
VLRWRAAGRNVGVTLIPGGPVVCGLLAGIGLCATGFATVVSLIPPADSVSPGLFLLKGVGGCMLIIAVGWVLCQRGRTRMRMSAAASSAGVAQSPPRDQK